MYVHLDCNNFFVSCELVSRPELKGTPVVVANNNDNNGGIILALNQEAKAVGLKRGNPIFQVKKIIEQNKVTVIDVHHQLYHDISHRIMEEVRETEMVLDFVQYSRRRNVVCSIIKLRFNCDVTGRILKLKHQLVVLGTTFRPIPFGVHVSPSVQIEGIPAFCQNPSNVFCYYRGVGGEGQECHG
jgi:hypothetical protein